MEKGRAALNAFRTAGSPGAADAARLVQPLGVLEVGHAAESTCKFQVVKALVGTGDYDSAQGLAKAELARYREARLCEFNAM